MGLDRRRRGQASSGPEPIHWRCLGVLGTRGIAQLLCRRAIEHQYLPSRGGKRER